MSFTVLLDPRALKDIQESINYYDEQEPGLGKVFENNLDKHFKILKNNPFFQVRYDNVHCMPISKFPHMIHFTINEKRNEVVIRAIFHTSRDNKALKSRK